VITRVCACFQNEPDMQRFSVGMAKKPLPGLECALGRRVRRRPWQLGILRVQLPVAMAAWRALPMRGVSEGLERAAQRRDLAPSISASVL